MTNPDYSVSDRGEMIEGLVEAATGSLSPSEVEGSLESLEKLWSLTKHSQPSSPIRWQSAKAYWRIRIAREPSEAKQVRILMSLMGKDAPLPNGQGVQIWAIDELSGRGVREAMPLIAERIHLMWSGGRAEAYESICRRKIEIVSSGNLEASLIQELHGGEITSAAIELKKWCITRLAKLHTETSIEALVKYALELQDEYYDRAGDILAQKQTRHIWAALVYNHLISALKLRGLRTTDLRERGIHPGKFFLMI